MAQFQFLAPEIKMEISNLIKLKLDVQGSSKSMLDLQLLQLDQTNEHQLDEI